jgi:hypothetical protein
MAVTCGEMLRKLARPSTRRGSRSKVSCISAPFRSSIWLAQDPLPTFVSLSLVFSGLRTALGNTTTQAEAV